MTTLGTRSLAAVSVVLCALTLGAQAHAQDAQPAAPAVDPGARAASVQKLSEEGATLYQARDYRRANEKFQQAYAIDPDPNLLYNIGKCFEALGERAAAVEKYEAFLRAPGGDLQGRLKAQESLRVLKAQQQAQSAATAPHPTPAPTATADTADRGGATRTAAWVTLGGGVALAAGGTVVYLLGASDHNKVSSATNFDKPGQVVDMTEARANELRDSGTTKKTVGAVLWGVGGAAVVTAAVLFVVQGRAGASEGSVAVGAVPLPGGAAASLVGRF